jgi:hypothetical protein
LCIKIPASSAYGIYISQITRYSGIDVSYLDNALLLTSWNWSSWQFNWTLHIGRFVVAIMILLVATHCLSHEWRRVRFHCRNVFPYLLDHFRQLVLCVDRCSSFFFWPFWLPLWYLQTILTKIWSLPLETQWVQHVKQELLTLPEHLHSLLFFHGVRVDYCRNSYKIVDICKLHTPNTQIHLSLVNSNNDDHL